MATEIKESSTNVENLQILAKACDVNIILGNIGLRWKMQILYCIANEAHQFSTIKKVFPTISDQILGKRVSELYKEKLIIKIEVPDTVPQQIKYEVTEKGNELLMIILNLNSWGEKWK
ncbi:winged helix-turn-helix transcriptional regulator [Autumnicola musiva]|uniref:Helix-turn-helix domain-containing protein n=1 Tax=Autumnicola musiva TaxID=3075589 RepID=A0ABU3DCQ8_9FLAO|nr:helix-turn-helix domain-containing protein [Zunongwangia sp. F117]MDT0678768.1 helix-turn-helix domain-containing protein [Zunongwangia sp. F117]